MRQLKRIAHGFATRSDSSIDLVWANLGAGKTHALLHLCYILEAKAGVQCSTVFFEMPDRVKSFVEIYRAIVGKLDHNDIAELVHSADRPSLPTDLVQASQVFMHGNAEERQLASEWIEARRPHLTRLRKHCGINMRIEDDVTAVEMLNAMVAGHRARQRRLVVLIDEFQRLNNMPPASKKAVLASLRSIFSANPDYFSVLIAVSSRIESTALEMLPEELATLLGMRPKLSLPEMDTTESLTFVAERFACYRPKDFSGGPYAPFKEEAVVEVVRRLEATGTPLIPRNILQALGLVYDDAAMDDVTSIDASFANEALAYLSDA